MSKSLLTVIEGVYDPGDLCSHFLLEAHDQLAAAGVSVEVQADFERYRRLNLEHGATWFTPMPMFDSELSKEIEGFWFEGRDRAGDLVYVTAGRLYRTALRSAADLTETLEVYYSAPEAARKPGETCSGDAIGLKRMAGRILYDGGLWIAPEYRNGKGRLEGLSTLVSRMTRALAVQRFKPDYSCSFMEPVLAKNGVSKGYGYLRVEPGMRWINSPYGEDYEMLLIWMDRTEILRDLASVMRLRGLVRAVPPSRR